MKYPSHLSLEEDVSQWQLKMIGRGGVAIKDVIGRGGVEKAAALRS